MGASPRCGAASPLSAATGHPTRPDPGRSRRRRRGPETEVGPDHYARPTVHLAMLLEMTADGLGDRVALGPREGGITMAELARRARRAGAFLASRPGERVTLVDLNSDAVPVLIFGAAFAGKPFVPVNYRLTDAELRAIVTRTAPATAIVGDGIVERLGDIEDIEYVHRRDLLDVAGDDGAEQTEGWGGEPDDIAVLLFTSGTTGEPKAAVLRHRHLASYIVSTVEFAAAGDDEAAIIS